MLKLALSLVAVAATFVTTTAAQATRGTPQASPPHHWTTMTLTEKHQVVAHEIRVERSVVRWWFHPRRRFPTDASSRYRKCVALNARAPGMVCAAGQRLVNDLRLQARIERALTPPPPANPHLALWLCIHAGEGGWGANTGNGYYDGLQMTWGWGPLEGSPNNYTPKQLMAAAEQEYQASGYSRTWLSGQWPNTVQSCWQYAA